MKSIFTSRKKNNQPEDNVNHTDLQDFDSADDQQIRGLSNLYSPDEESQTQIRDIADELYESGKLNAEQIERIRQQQRGKPNFDIFNAVRQIKTITPEDILQARAKLYGFEYRRIVPDEVDKKAFDLLDIYYIKSNHVMPVAVQNGKLIVATSEPGNVFIIDDVKRNCDMEVQIVVCSQTDIEIACEMLTARSLDYDVDDIISDMDDVEVVQDEENDFEDLEKMAGESPVIKFVNYLISNAVHEKASDIHIEPKIKFTRVRYRIDGVLFETMQAPVKMHSAVISRLKIMSNLDISERRLPQDGKISVIVGRRNIDLRISTLPTSNGEKVVIRLLDKKSIMRGLDDSGMVEQTRLSFEELIHAPHGIMLVTGPTGSGKSTTLYSALAQMDGDTTNISTVEDPVEYVLEYCNQVQVNDRIGLTFSAALRSLLRQDPDIIMIGEIRDNETARIAVQAALTGHLVLSTLHTNDAPSSITRLVNIGVDPYLVAASVNGVLAQRLVRTICSHCKELYDVPKNMKKHLERANIDPDSVYKGRGCEKCRDSGYSGRIGIYELLEVNDEIRRIINTDPSTNSLQKAFKGQNGRTLFDDGIEKVRMGITTIEEVLRVTESGDIDVGDDFLDTTEQSQKNHKSDTNTKRKKPAPAKVDLATSMKTQTALNQKEKNKQDSEKENGNAGKNLIMELTRQQEAEEVIIENPIENDSENDGSKDDDSANAMQDSEVDMLIKSSRARKK